MVVGFREELEVARVQREQDQAERWQALDKSLQDIQSQLTELRPRK